MTGRDLGGVGYHVLAYSAAADDSVFENLYMVGTHRGFRNSLYDSTGVKISSTLITSAQITTNGPQYRITILADTSAGTVTAKACSISNDT